MRWCGASGEMARLGFIYSHECIKLVFGLALVAHMVRLGVVGNQDNGGGQGMG